MTTMLPHRLAQWASRQADADAVTEFSAPQYAGRAQSASVLPAALQLT
jgi:hypothetical protein